jgi:putative oxidoreductase
MSALGYFIGRLALVAIFPISGYFKVMQWPAIAGVLEKEGIPYSVPVAAVGVAAEFILPLLILIGWQTRLAAWGLIVFTAVATYIGHKFWAVPADQFFGQFVHFLKNMAIIGGLMIVASLGPRPWADRSAKD